MSLFLIIYLFKRDFNTGVFLVNIAKCFDWKPLVASVNLLFLTKSNVGWFLLKMVDLLIVCIIYTLLVETILTFFYWLTCRNQKLVESKPMQQRLFVLITAFWQCRQLFVHYLNLVSTMFYQIFIFLQMIALQKLWKMFFISSKKLFLFLRYLNFYIFVFPSFFPCQPLL